MENTEERGTSDLPEVPVRPKGRPGRKPKGSAPVVIPETPDKPDPDHVLTWRQRKVLQVIRDSVQKRGYPPSMREIGEAVGLTSTSSVSYQLSTLQKKGYLHRDVGLAADGRGPAARAPGGPPRAEQQGCRRRAGARRRAYIAAQCLGCDLARCRLAYPRSRAARAPLGQVALREAHQSIIRS